MSKAGLYKLRDIDAAGNAIRQILLFGNAICFVVAFCMMWIGIELPAWKSIVLAVFLVAFLDGIFLLILRGASSGIDGFLGFGRPVDQNLLEFQAKREVADAKLRRGEFEEAAKLYRLIVDHPNNKNPVTTAFKLADLYANHLARPDDALYWYRKCLSLIRSGYASPQEHPLWTEVQRGLESFAGLRATDDADYAFAILTAMDLIEAGHMDEARAKCDDLLRRYPARADSWYWAGVVEFKEGRVPMAAERYREAITRDPAHLKALFNLGLALRKMDQFPEAREIWSKYITAARDIPAEADYLSDAQRMLEAIEKELKPSMDY